MTENAEFNFNRSINKTEDGLPQVQYQTFFGGANFLLVVDKNLGKDKQTVSLSMDSEAVFTDDREFVMFLDALDEKVTNAIEIFAETEYLDLVWELDGVRRILPEHLVRRQGLTQKEVDVVKFLQKNRASIEAAMAVLNPEDHETELIILYDSWQENEDKLQLAWRFPLKRNMQRWFDVPHCKCPKMDNEDFLGTDRSYFTGGCIYHGRNFNGV